MGRITEYFDLINRDRLPSQTDFIFYYTHIRKSNVLKSWSEVKKYVKILKSKEEADADS